MYTRVYDYTLSNITTEVIPSIIYFGGTIAVADVYFHNDEWEDLYAALINLGELKWLLNLLRSDDVAVAQDISCIGMKVGPATLFDKSLYHQK